MRTQTNNYPVNSHAGPSRRDGADAGLFHVGFNPLQGRVGMSTSYLGAALAAAVVVGIVALGFFLGRTTASTGGDASAALASTTPMPEVMDVGDNASRTGTPPPSARLDPRETVTPSAQRALPPAGPVNRVGGMNYVLVESYAKSEQDRAEATVAALRQAGIGATIEQNVPGWSTRLCVFGTEPFERVKDNEQYRAYIGKMLAVSNAHSSNKLIKRFNPTAVQWGR